MSWNRTRPPRQSASPEQADVAARRPAAGLAAREFAAVGWFVLRTPLLPFDELVAWSDGLAAPAALRHDVAERLEEALARDRELLRARLQAAAVRPDVREALLVASPSLDESIPVWLSSPDSERGLKVEGTLARYFARMAGRPTPFGLFAGCSFGRLGDHTRLAVADRGRYRRHTRLDMDYLCSLADQLRAREEVRADLTVRPSSSLYRAGARLRYAEARFDGRARTYHLVAVEPTPYLEATLARAERGVPASALARALVDDDPDVELAEAEGFIAELIDSQVLVGELEPAVTGPEPVHGMIAALRAIPGSADAALAAERLDRTCAVLADLDAAPPGAVEPPYRAIAGELGDLPAPVEISRLFQVDMIKPAPELALGRAVIDEVSRAVELLHRLATRGQSDALGRFREQFNRRWEGQEIPLVQALDAESGIGFAADNEVAAEPTPLLEGLAFAGAPPTLPPTAPGFAHILRRLQQGGGALALILDESDLQALAEADPPPLPDAFAVKVALAAASDDAIDSGDFRIHWQAASGPAGAALLGRFCHALPELEGAVRSYLADEAALRPDAIFAEIVHLPQGRVGNVLLRPVLRSHEIAFLGGSTAPDDRRIPVGDLLVSVAGDRVRLRSRRLGREVFPRLSTAHNYNQSGLGIYRFLCALQSQGTARLGWTWGALEASSFLPRVELGKVVLACARWRLDESQLRPLRSLRGAALFRAVQALRAALGLPRHVALVDGDNLLPIDLDNAISADTFAHLTRGRPVAILSEMSPGPDQLCARGPEGRFVHELVIPFLRTRSASAAVGAPAAPLPSTGSARRFPPGSEWLYAKIYAGPGSVDGALLALAPAVRGALRSGASDGWFFIRYGDPDWHLRLRLRGEPARLSAEVLPALRAALDPLLSDGRIWNMQLDTYVRELERYGGEAAMPLCERIFQADSEAVLSIVEALSGDAGADARWRLALAGFDRLYDDLGFDLPGRLAQARRLRESFGRELRADVRVDRQLGDRYRRERLALEQLLAPGGGAGADGAISVGLAALSARSRAIAPAIAALRVLHAEGRLTVSLEQLAASLTHKHANRLLRSAGRAQELVLHDLLLRLYTAREARARTRRGRQGVSDARSRRSHRGSTVVMAASSARPMPATPVMRPGSSRSSLSGSRGRARCR
jgi:thiopeptide-type bacteriocin biosynthesis protein